MEQHAEFFRYVAQSFDDPRYTLHFQADAPVSIRALFYVPQSHMEKWGMARQESGVHLYCRKVLIQSKCEILLPEWMRFFRGVVDSEDIPLNISRETMQVGARRHTPPGRHPDASGGPLHATSISRNLPYPLIGWPACDQPHANFGRA